jgi:8-oxo-dGTP pyrophosphatase MutT (NUDIX family)
MGGDHHFGEFGAPLPEAQTPAAVLVPVVDRPEPGLLLTRRTANLRAHAGQIAFPGGRVDPEDDGPVAAALREAEEEIGLAPADVRVLGLGDGWRTGTGYAITPVVGAIPPGLRFVPSAAEVDAVFEVPLAHVLDPANHQLREAEWQGRARRFYVIEANGWEIWGATAGMIVNLSRRLGC